MGYVAARVLMVMHYTAIPLYDKYYTLWVLSVYRKYGNRRIRSIRCRVRTYI